MQNVVAGRTSFRCEFPSITCSWIENILICPNAFPAAFPDILFKRLGPSCPLSNITWHSRTTASQRAFSLPVKFLASWGLVTYKSRTTVQANRLWTNLFSYEVYISNIKFLCSLSLETWHAARNELAARLFSNVNKDSQENIFVKST